MKVAVVGSRRRHDGAAIAACVLDLPDGTTVVSGGCRGPDTWAVAAAMKRGLPVIVIQPDLTVVKSRFAAAQLYYDRNQAIVDACDRVIAFPAADRKGGTEDTIRRALRAGKPVEIRGETGQEAGAAVDQGRARHLSRRS